MARDLIVFGEDWGGLPSSTQHLIKHLAFNRKILWVNSIGLRRPKLRVRDLRRVAAKISSKFGRKPSRSANEAPLPRNISIINVMTFPAPRSRFERYCARQLLVKQLKPRIDALGLHDPLLWTSLPTAADVVGCLGERGVAYYCGDDFASLEGVDHDVVSLHEQTLVQQSDLIVTASDALRQKFPSEKTRTLTHGVDFDLFSQPAPRASDLPCNGKPIAGFYGSLSAWIDRQLLAEVISALPHWNFVFIGKEVVDMSVLKALDNAYFLGPRPHHMLPSYSQHWHAALLPFKDNAQIRACNPLKLSEYLAAGRPIISTDFPALAPCRDIVHRVASAPDFIAALQMSEYAASLPQYSEALRSRVIGHTWRDKSAQMGEWLEAI